MTNKYAFILLAAASCSVLQGCAAFEGPQAVLQPEGPPLKNATKTGQFAIFQSSYGVSYGEAKSISSPASADQTAVAAPTKPGDAVSVHARQMALDGMDLVDSNCAKFFETRGSDETYLNVSKDVTTASGTLASGVLSFVSPANAVPSGVISLVTSTANSALDIYTKNFLFGSDNIDTIRTMTFNALDAHRQAVLDANKDAIWTFGGVQNIVMYHQNICTPAKIRTFALQSLSKATFGPQQTSATPPAVQPQANQLQQLVAGSPLSASQNVQIESQK